jgi:hypothetical protein
MNSSAPAVLKTTCALAIWRDTESPRDTDLPEPCHRCGDKLGEADAQSPLIPLKLCGTHRLLLRGCVPLTQVGHPDAPISAPNILNFSLESASSGRCKFDDAHQG